MARRSCLAAIFTIGGLALFGSSLSNATVPEVQNTVTHGGVTVHLSGQSYCGWAQAAEGKPLACTANLCPEGCSDSRLPVVTPGSVDIRMLVPMQFLEAGSVAKTHKSGHRMRETKAFVRQIGASDAKITYRRLRPGEVAWVSARYRGQVYVFFYLPVARNRASVKRG
jgi:hypothetical protein